MKRGGKKAKMSNIDNNPTWNWAKGDHFQGKAKKLKGDVDTAVTQLGDIGMSYMSGTSVQQLVYRHTEQTVSESLEKIDGILSPSTNALKSHVEKVGAMHESNCNRSG